MLQFLNSVGTLCTHLLFAFQLGMMEAPKMLEGDYDIPKIPDSPLPSVMYVDTLDLESSICLSSSLQWPSSAATGLA
jgi:hypothetical protein